VWFCAAKGLFFTFTPLANNVIPNDFYTLRSHILTTAYEKHGKNGKIEK
jgi:hypothetical protein